MICFFCSAQTSNPKLYPCPSTREIPVVRVEGAAYLKGSMDPLYACPDCEALIEARDSAGLLDRMKGCKFVAPEAQATFVDDFFAGLDQP